MCIPQVTTGPEWDYCQSKHFLYICSIIIIIINASYKMLLIHAKLENCFVVLCFLLLVCLYSLRTKPLGDNSLVETICVKLRVEE